VACSSNDKVGGVICVNYLLVESYHTEGTGNIEFCIYLDKSRNSKFHSYAGIQDVLSWDGLLYDCDFNLAEYAPVGHGVLSRLCDFDMDRLSSRRIVTGEYCFGCTAGHGSSCSGAIAPSS